ncbi:hypothetical protein MRY82_01200 [bacterium]|nr:hypothetical protein [bacterium]
MFTLLLCASALVLYSCGGLQVSAVREWIHPSSDEDFVSLQGQDAGSAEVATDASGNAIVAWKQNEGNDRIMIGEYRNGTWTWPTSIDDNINPGTSDTDSPSIAMDDDGNAIVVWEQEEGSDYNIFISEYRNGSWTHPADTNDYISPNSGSLYDAEVAMDNNGNAIVAWIGYDGADDQVFISEYRNGSWTHPADADDNISPDGQDVYDMEVAMDDNGNAIIVWEQYNGTDDQIFISEYRNGSWTHPADLNDFISVTGEESDDPEIAMDNNGNAIIVWTQYIETPDVERVYMSEYRNGSWTHPADEDDYISVTSSDDTYDPTVAMDNDGNAIIVWYQNDSSEDQQVFMSEYRNGSWDHPSSLSDNISPDGEDVYDVQVAMDNNGNAIIAWDQYDGENDQIFMSEYRNGKWDHPDSINDNISPDSDDDTDDPIITMSDSGNAFITWDQYLTDGDFDAVFISQYVIK